MLTGLIVLAAFWYILHRVYSRVPSTEAVVSIHEAERRRGVPFLYA